MFVNFCAFFYKETGARPIFEDNLLTAPAVDYARTQFAVYIKKFRGDIAKD